MAITNYTINRAIDKPIEFRGLKGQYILHAGVILVVDFILFAVLYLFHVPSLVCVVVSFGLGGGGISVLYRRSRKYGAFGSAKIKAMKKVPNALQCGSISIFTSLKRSHAKVTRKSHAHPGDQR